MNTSVLFHRKILIIENDADFARSVKVFLTSKGFRCTIVDDAYDVEAHLVNYVTDLVTLNIGLSDSSGLDLLKLIRRKGFDVPVIIVSEDALTETKVLCLESGADDVIVKPFDNEELSARIDSLLRRTDRRNDVLFRLGVLEVDLLRHEVRSNGNVLRLGQKEFALLNLFLRNVNRLLTREDICTRIWGDELAPNNNLVDVHISKLRRNLSGMKGAPKIETVYGKGFVLQIEEASRRRLATA